MGPRHRPARATILGGCLLMVAAGCAADPSGASLDRATGAVLADGADRLAEALEAEDACRALLEADALRARASDALEADEAPEDVVVETTRVVDAATSGLTCEVQTEPAPEPDETDEPDETEPGEAATPEPAPQPEPEPAPAPDEDEPDPGNGGGSGGPSGPSQGQGPDGDGPPGHRDDRGGG